MVRLPSQAFSFSPKSMARLPSQAFSFLAKIDGAVGVCSGCVCLGFGARTCIATKGMAQ